MKLLDSGKVERLRQKESCGKRSLVVAADTGLMSGEGVRAFMIGGPTMQRPEQAALGVFWRVQARSHDIEKNVQDLESGGRMKTVFGFEE